MAAPVAPASLGTEVTVQVTDAQGQVTPKEFIVLSSSADIKPKRDALFAALAVDPMDPAAVQSAYNALKSDVAADPAANPPVAAYTGIAYGGRRHKKHGTRKGRKARHGKRKQTRQRK